MNSLMLLSITAPSGCGKTTIAKNLVKEYRGDFINSISYTTRLPREDEVDGRDYYFVGEQEFKKLIDQNKFLEWASYMGNFYGTPVTEIKRCEDLGKCGIIFVLENEGVKQLKCKYPDAISVFIIPTCVKEVYYRMKKDNDRNDVEKRIKNARKEIEAALDYDYIVENNFLSQAINTTNSIITAELLRPSYMCKKVKSLLQTKGIVSEL